MESAPVKAWCIGNRNSRDGSFAIVLQQQLVQGGNSRQGSAVVGSVDVDTVGLYIQLVAVLGYTFLGSQSNVALLAGNQRGVYLCIALQAYLQVLSSRLQCSR